MNNEVGLPSEIIHGTNDVKTAWEYKDRCFFLRLNKDGTVAQVASSFLQTNCDDVYFILEKHGGNDDASSSSPLGFQPKYFGLDQQASVETEIQAWMDKEDFWMIVDWPGHGEDSAWQFFNAVRRRDLDPRTSIGLTLTHPPPQSPGPFCMTCRLSN